MKKVLQIVFVAFLLSVVVLPQIAVEKIYAEDAKFSGVTVMIPPSAPSEAAVPDVMQAKSQWCWAAVSSSVLQHYNLTVSQQQVAIYVKGGTINESASDYDIVSALRYFGVNASSFAGTPSYAQVQREINKGNPIINLIDWRSGGGHFQVLEGYFSSGGRDYIKVMDPLYGDHYEYAYDYYKSNAKFWWNLYIDNFSKR